MASHFPPRDDSRAVALTPVAARAFFCNGNLGEALLGGAGGVEGCDSGAAVSYRHPLGRYQRRLSASLYGRGCTSPRPAFCLLQSKTAPWVFTKGTGESPGKSVPSFSPTREPLPARRANRGGPLLGGAGGGVSLLSSRHRRPVSIPVARRRLGSPPVRAEASGVPPFSPVAPGRRRRGFSTPSPLRRRLVIPGHDTQSPWDAEALVLECQPRASQANTAPSLIVRRGGILALLPVPDMLEGCACCPPEPFPRHRWLRASQSSWMAWPVAGDSAHREVQR